MSFTRPPRTRTIECSWRLWPSPGMYAVTSMPLVSRTRATLRSAEFGFFGVVVYTRVHTPRRCGAATFFLRPLPDFRPGVESFFGLGFRPLRMSWLVVGMRRTMLAARVGPPACRSRRRDGRQGVARGRVLEALAAGNPLPRGPAGGERQAPPH